MKKILSLLILVPLMAISQTIPADATALENLQITNNTTSLTAPFVTVQETNGVINKINKADLVNVVEVNDVPSLPLIGEVGKIYVVKNLNKIYRWNGTFYQELAGSDLTYQSVIDALAFTPENVANKATDFTTINNNLYPTSLAVQNRYFDTTKKWVIFGDSFSNQITENDYPFYVIQDLKLTGTETNAVAGHRIEMQLAVLKSQLSSNPSYLNGFNIMSLLVGVNDFAGSWPMGNRNSLPTDLNYAGYLKDFIETALRANPAIELYIMTPCEANGAGVSYGTVNSAGWSLKELSILISQICSDYAVKCIDLYSQVQFNEFTIPTLTTDGLHPSLTGVVFIKDVIKNAFIDKRTSYKPIDFSGRIYPDSFLPYFKDGSLRSSWLSQSGNELLVANTSPDLVLTRPTSANAFNGYKWRTNTTLESEVSFNSSNAELKIASGRSAAWGGNITFYTDTTEKGSFSALGVFKVNNLSGTASRIVMSDTSGNMSAPANLVHTGNAEFIGTVTAPTFSGNSTSTTNWGGRLANLNANAGTIFRPLVVDASDNVVKLAVESQLQSWLGLGSNAYSSTVFAPISNAALIGVPTAPTAAAGTNTTQIATTAFVQSNSRPYKVYTALLTQSGTNVPTATVLENTLGGTVVWTRNSVGNYTATLSGAFTFAKTWVAIDNNIVDPVNNYTSQSDRFDINTIISTSKINGTASDGALRSSIEIRVYL